jgi:hypothetical protein
MKSILIVFEKKNFDNIRVLNSKFVIILKILLFAFLCDKSDIFDVSRDLWLRVLAQRVKRQKFDDESQMMQNVCRNSIFFLLWSFSFRSTFSNNFVKSFRYATLFILCVDVSLSSWSSRTFHFKKNLISNENFAHDTEFSIDFKMQHWIWKT